MKFVLRLCSLMPNNLEIAITKFILLMPTEIAIIAFRTLVPAEIVITVFRTLTPMELAARLCPSLALR